MGEIITERLENGTTNKRFIGVNSIGYTDMTYNGNYISPSQQTLLLRKTNNDRINFEIKIRNFEKYGSINSVKLVVKTTSINTGRTLFLTKESSMISDDDVKIDEFKTIDNGITYELDFAKYINGTDGETLYFALRSDAVAYIPSQFYNNCPEIIVNYVSNNQGLTNQKHISGNVGRALNYDINVRNGQPFFTKSLISFEGNLMPINLGLVFNGTHINETWFNGMPYGWKTNYHQKIGSNTNGTKTYTDAKGLEHIFEKALNSNSVYFDTAGSGLILTVNNDSTYTIDDGYKNYLDFDSSGYLEKIRRVIGANVISTIINYDSSKRISSIVDGMGRTYNFTYNTSNIVVSGPGVQNITLIISSNKLTKVTECGGRYSDYTYVDNYLSTAVSDNGEKTVFTYDSVGRIINASDYFVNPNENLIDIKYITYQLTTTVVSNKKGLKIQYSFNPEGECIGEYEVVSNGDGSFKSVEKTDFEAYRSVVIKDKFYQYDYGSASGGETTLSLKSTIGNMSVSSSGKYIITFKYMITGALDNKEDAQHLLLIYQSSELISAFNLDPRIDYEKNESFLFTCTSDTIPTVKLVHYNNEGTTRIKDIRIYKVNISEVHDCIDKYCGGGWGLTYASSAWHQLPTNLNFSYYDSVQDQIVDINKPMTLSDIEENQKNYKQNNTNHHVWYNKKRGMIASTKNVVIIVNNTSYPLNGFVVARVNVTKNQKHWQYKEYPASLSDPTKLRYERECILRGGVYNSSSKLITSDYLVYSGTGFDGVSYSYTYDAYGNILTFTSGAVGKQNKITNTYFDYNLLKSETTYVGNAQTSTTSYTYDACGRVKTITHPNGAVTTYTYDTNTGNLKEVSENVGGVINRNVISYTKDNVISMYSDGMMGYKFTKDQYNLFSQVNAFKTGSTYSFINFENDLGNNLDSNVIRYNDDFTEEFLYDKFGNLVLKKYGTAGTADTKELELYYSDDDADSISTTIASTSSSLKKTKNSKLRIVLDRRTNNTQKHYYSDGLLNQITNTSQYDVSRKVLTHDELDRLKTERIESSGGTLYTTITYRDADLSNLNDVSLIEADVQWNYNGSGYSGSYSKSNVLDSSKRVIEEVMEVGNYSCKKNYTYKIASNYFSTSQPEKVTYTTSYLSNASSTLGNITYTYNNMGNITKIVDTVTGNTINYTYDSLGRLTREDNSKLGVSKTWEYDQHGNITLRKEGSYTTSAFTSMSEYSYLYNTVYPDRISSYGGSTVSYDANGNIVSLGSNMFTWTRGSLLNSCTKAGMNYTFNYNSNGLRTKKYHDLSDYTNYIYDGNKLISEHKVTSSGEFDINYVYAENEIIGFTYKNKHYYYVKNIQGDIIKLMNSANSVVATYVYDAWGNHKVYNSSGVENTSSTWIGNINPIRYRGYYYDVETGLFMVGHRYYNPEWGRWLSPDDIEYLDPQSINGLNLYAYCNNDPLNKYDPTGHFAMPTWLKWTIGAVVLVGTVVAAVATGGAALAVGAAVGAGVGAGLGLASGITLDENGGFSYDWDKAASGFMFGSITGAISGVAGAYFDEAIKAGSMLAKGAMALIDGTLSLGSYIGQTALDSHISDVTLGGVLISFGSGLFSFADRFGGWLDDVWGPMMGAEIAWAYDLFTGKKRKRKM